MILQSLFLTDINDMLMLEAVLQCCCCSCFPCQSPKTIIIAITLWAGKIRFRHLLIERSHLSS